MIKYSSWYAWNTLGIFRILSVFDFHFTPSFMDKCVADCMEENSLGPLILALYAFETKLILSRASQKESLPLINLFKKKKAF